MLACGRGWGMLDRRGTRRSNISQPLPHYSISTFFTKILGPTMLNVGATNITVLNGFNCSLYIIQTYDLFALPVIILCECSSLLLCIEHQGDFWQQYMFHSQLFDLSLQKLYCWVFTYMYSDGEKVDPEQDFLIISICWDWMKNDLTTIQWFGRPWDFFEIV